MKGNTVMASAESCTDGMRDQRVEFSPARKRIERMLENRCCMLSRQLCAGLKLMQVVANDFVQRETRFKAERNHSRFHDFLLANFHFSAFTPSLHHLITSLCSLMIELPMVLSTEPVSKALSLSSSIFADWL